MKLYEKFIRFIINKDSRNYFSKTAIDVSRFNTDKFFVKFYKHFNPVDVEVDLGERGVLRFFPAEELPNVQQEYNVDDYFVFASIEGDPVAIKEGRIYRALHGDGRYDFKEINSDFISFLKGLID